MPGAAGWLGLGFRSGFEAEVKQARPALPLPEVHAARWEAAFARKRDDVEKLEAQKERCNDRRLQDVLHWESEHEDNLIHMSRLGKRAVQARRRLSGLDPIPPSDDEDSGEDSDEEQSSDGQVASDDDGDAVHESAPASDNTGDVLPGKKKTAPPPEPYFLLPFADGKSGHCSDGLLRPSVLRVLYCAWHDRCQDGGRRLAR